MQKLKPREPKGFLKVRSQLRVELSQILYLLQTCENVGASEVGELSGAGSSDQVK